LTKFLHVRVRQTEIVSLEPDSCSRSKHLSKDEIFSPTCLTKSSIRLSSFALHKTSIFDLKVRKKI